MCSYFDKRRAAAGFATILRLLQSGTKFPASPDGHRWLTAAPSWLNTAEPPAFAFFLCDSLTSSGVINCSTVSSGAGRQDGRGNCHSGGGGFTKKTEASFYLHRSDSWHRLHHHRQAARLVWNHGEIKVNKDFRQLGCKNVLFGRCTLSIMVHMLERVQHHGTEPSADNELLMLAMMSRRFYFSK